MSGRTSVKKDEETENTAHSGESELSQDQVRAAQALHSSQRSDLGIWGPHQCRGKLPGDSEAKCMF